MAPMELAPMNQQQDEWPKWGQYVETKGKSGEAPDLPAAIELVALLKNWFQSTTHEQQAAIWEKMLKINADEVFTIGLIAGVKQPVVVSNRLKNVPETGIYNWDPGAHFGIYSTDTFWFEQAQTAQTVQ
jgi:peptide/nickel transport system substrate-binding protein